MNEFVELVEQKDFFGFPVCVYRFKKHDEHKSSMIKHLNSHEIMPNFYNAGSHLRTDGLTKPFLKGNVDCVKDLKRAFDTATEHFYKDVLKAQMSLDDTIKSKSYNLSSKPEIINIFCHQFVEHTI